MLTLGCWNAAAQTADNLFDDSFLHEVRITINPNDWQALKTHFFENTYYQCDVQFDGVLVRDVGIRSRGAGSRSPVKPGLRVDFDRYLPDQEFLNLKSVVLDNMLQDPSFIREHLSMLLFRRMGLPAPREAFARFYINGEYSGLYSIVESVDKRFLTRNFRENDGYLYHYEWNGPYRFEYLGADLAKYVPLPFEPRTHEKDGDHRPLEAMIRTMNQATDSDFVRAMSEYLDLKIFMTHVGIENFLAEPDGILGSRGLANFDLYRFERKNLHQFIAWDKDLTMTDVEFPILRNVSDDVLMRRAWAAPELQQVYLEALFLSVAASDGWMVPEASRAYTQIRQAALEDRVKPGSNADFEAEVVRLMDFAARRRDYVLRELASAGLVARLEASQPSLQFQAAAGGGAAQQTLTITSTIAAGLLWTASVSGANWLEVTPSSGVTPATVTARATPGTLAPGKYAAAIAVSNPLVAAVSVPVEFTILAPGETPQLSQGGAVNAATFSAAVLAPGSLISIFGQRLAGTTAQASSLPLPTELNGVSFRINGIAAPLLFVSPGQVNLQVPWEVTAGSATITATVSGISSNSITANIGPYSPGVFVVVHHADAALVTAERPAVGGEFLVVYANGLGPVTGGVRTGQAAPPDPLATTLETPVVTVGDTPAEVVFSGLTPGLVGLYQINVRLAASIPAGTQTPLVVRVGGQTAPPVSLATR